MKNLVGVFGAIALVAYSTYALHIGLSVLPSRYGFTYVNGKSSTYLSACYMLIGFIMHLSYFYEKNVVQYKIKNTMLVALLFILIYCMLASMYYNVTT